MKFFTKFFNSVKNKSSINFVLNLFFIKQMLSINYNHTLLPYIFLPTKSLKINFFKSYNYEIWFNLTIVGVVILFLVGVVYFF